jgi:hypothetical protein
MAAVGDWKTLLTEMKAENAKLRAEVDDLRAVVESLEIRLGVGPNVVEGDNLVLPYREPKGPVGKEPSIRYHVRSKQWPKYNAPVVDDERPS